MINMFQSLNWDGVISNYRFLESQVPRQHVSIPQLGWGDFKLEYDGETVDDKKFQSLNWDGVISNSRTVFGVFGQTSQFQSLNWDGVISNSVIVVVPSTNLIVSIPQLGWGDFKLAAAAAAAAETPVSIPQLGWGDFKLSAIVTNTGTAGFNPSIGMG